jgi:hypothetical protein
MNEFDLAESFEIDDESLLGLTPQRCFVLGAEWEMFHGKLRLGLPFVDLVHSENTARLVRLVERHKRFVEHSQFEQGWTKIVVGNSIID